MAGRRPGESWPADLPVVAGLGPVDQALFRRAPRLRVIARTGVGVDLVDVPAATARGIAVVVAPGAGAAAVAEGTIIRCSATPTSSSRRT